MSEKANILTGCSAARCDRTFTLDHGSALPGGPFPGTFGDEGDVRICEHGKVWIFAYCEHHRIDVWRRVSRVFEPRTYRRARAALSGGTR